MQPIFDKQYSRNSEGGGTGNQGLPRRMILRESREVLHVRRKGLRGRIGPATVFFYRETTTGLP